MSSSLHQHTQGIIGYEHKRFEYKDNRLIIHICRKKKTFSCSKCKSLNVNATATGLRFIKYLPVDTKKTSFCV